MPASVDLPPTHSPITHARSPVRHLSVFLYNRVGALLSLVRRLNEHDIEVLGFSVQDSVELTLVRLVVTDPERAKQVFEADGHPCASKSIIVVELKASVRDLGHALSALLAAEINIHHSYPLLVRPDDKPLLALYVDDVEVGAESLAKSGFHVLSQDELSR
ncbi:MAG: acetolactate synthase [Roseimicrobium sp.]